jgi:hypothetical protein
MDYEAINDFRFSINESTCPLFPSLYALSEAVLKGTQFPFLQRSDPIAAKRMPQTSNLQARSALLPCAVCLVPCTSCPAFTHRASGTINGKRATT